MYSRRIPNNIAAMRPVEKAFIYSVMFELGILPIEDPGFDARRTLAQMSKDETQIVKRKFRKLWRKYAKQLKTGDRTSRMKAANLGMGQRVPTKAEHLARKKLVYERIWNDVIVPMLIKFENVEREQKKKDGTIDEKET
jgi:hypothetical protein